MDLRQIIDTYDEKLLVLQFEVTDKIEHKLTKGEVREKLIEPLLKGELENINIKNGIISCGEWQSSQADCIVLKKNGRSGLINVYDASDCMLFMEIKSCVVKSEYELLQKHAEDLKAVESDMLVGMFSYSSSAGKKTVLSQFGFKYDKDLDRYLEYDVSKDMYPDIDFYYNLNIDRTIDENGNEKLFEIPYCIVKDREGVKNLFLQPPVIANLINVFRSTIE